MKTLIFRCGLYAGGRCIKCGTLDFHSYQIDDYVKCVASPSDLLVEDSFRGMIWCWNGNCSHSVLDPYVQPVELSFAEAYERYPDCQLPPQSDARYYEVELARIDRIVDHNMLEYRAEQQLSDDEIAEFLPWTPRYGFEYEQPEFILAREEVMSRLGIRYEGDGEAIVPNFNISCPVNSYQVFDPEKPFPDGFSPDHAGCYINLYCTSSTGQEFRYLFWGD